MSYLRKVLLHLFSKLGGIVALPHVVQLLKEAGRPLIQQPHHVCLDAREPPQEHGKFPASCISVHSLEPQYKKTHDGRNIDVNSSLHCRADNAATALCGPTHNTCRHIKQAQAPATAVAHQLHSIQPVERSFAVKAMDRRIDYLTRKRSTVTVSRTKGRCTLTATCSPLCNLPRYTCNHNFYTVADSKWVPFQICDRVIQPCLDE